MSRRGRTPDAPHGAAGRSLRGRWPILVVACVAQFMVVLDMSVVNVALPSIQRDLGFGPTGLQWVINAYVLVFAGLLLVGGRIADVYGLRWAFCIGLALFALASLVGGLADTAFLLVAARAVQGVGAAIVAPASLTLLTTTYEEGRARTRALAIWAALGIAGGTAGNLLGGVLTEYLTWRSTMLVNVPIGAACLCWCLRALGRRPAGSLGTIELRGAILVTAGFASVTYGITQAGPHGWGHVVPLGGLVVGASLIAGFVVVESRSANPLIPVRLFRQRSIVVGNVILLLAGTCFMPMWFFLSLTMQNVFAYSPLETGLAFLPHTLVTMVVGVRLTPWLMRYVDARLIIAAGAAIAAVGFAWQSQVDISGGYITALLGPAVVFSIGGGLFNTPITATATAGVTASDAGAASGLLNTSKQLGGSLGLATLVLVAGTTGDAMEGYRRAFLVIAGLLVVVAVLVAGLPRPVRRCSSGGSAV